MDIPSPAPEVLAMRPAMLLALGSLALFTWPVAAHAQAAAETALTTAVTSSTATSAASKMRVPTLNLPSTATSSGSVHRYTRRTRSASSTHPVSTRKSKADPKPGQAAQNHPPRVTYRRIQ
jgi:hypothetical protein